MNYLRGMVASSIVSSLDTLVLDLEATLGQAKPGSVVLTTSFSKEDQLLTWAALKSGVDVDIVSLDTGCLFPATRQTWTETEAHFGCGIRSLEPDEADVAELGALSDIYVDAGARKACCAARKIRPLQKACAGKDWWLTGLRKAHSANRSGMEQVEWDAHWGLHKYHPLLDWSDAALEAAVLATEVPVNPLYNMGYASIGCAPCTRPVLPGEDVRAGRWWWEQSSKECGLHRG